MPVLTVTITPAPLPCATSASLCCPRLSGGGWTWKLLVLLSQGPGTVAWMVTPWPRHFSQTRWSPGQEVRRPSGQRSQDSLPWCDTEEKLHGRGPPADRATCQMLQGSKNQRNRSLLWESSERPRKLGSTEKHVRRTEAAAVPAPGAQGLAGIPGGPA